MSPYRVLILAALPACMLMAAAAADEAGALAEPSSVADASSHDQWRSDSVLTDNISLYRPNYLLPVSWAPNPEDDDSRSEIQFQLSLLLQVLDTPVHFAYTQTAFWEAYDEDESRPFREINFNPEVFYRLAPQRNPLAPVQVDAGWDHTSNGRAGALSRSWDRAFIRSQFATGRYRITLSVWDVINRSGQMAEDNPDILDYQGYHELEVDVRLRGRDRLSIMNRYNFSTGYGANRLRYSLPTGGDGFWFLQVFNGHGESLIDYDRNVTRIGIGWAVSR